MKHLVLLMLPFLLLSACGAEKSGAAGSSEIIEPIAVEITTQEQIEAGQTVLLSAAVKQGEETVEDAEVVFEVWESGSREEGKMIEAEHNAKGLYEAEAEFEEGLYFIQAHTSARMMHAMPKQELMVGNPDPATIVPDDSDDSEGMKNIDGHSGH